MMEITKEELVDILKGNIYWLEKDISNSHHDIRDYQRLEDEDFEYIADEMLVDLEELFSKKRSMKIKKIKERL